MRSHVSTVQRRLMNTSSASMHQSRFRPRHPNARQQAIIDRMLRVDHAGEYGAIRIYDGQLAVLRNAPSAPVIEEMRQQEQVHLDTLSDMVPQRRVRPSLLLPLWNVAGYALGASTALLGERGAMACTVAVEEVISEHYNDQLRQLRKEGWEDEEYLKKIIKKHRDEEDEHRHIGLEHDAENAPFYSALSSVIKAGCRAAVYVSERV